MSIDEIIQSENQFPDNQPRQSSSSSTMRGFLPIAHEQLPQDNPSVAKQASSAQEPPVASAYTAPITGPMLNQYYSDQAFHAVDPTPPRQYQPPQYQPQYAPPYQPTSPPVTTVPIQQAQAPISNTAFTTMPMATPASQDINLPRSSRKKVLIVIGFLTCFITGTAVGLYVPLPSILSGGSRAASDSGSSSLLAPLNFQYSILEDNSSLFLTWSHVKGASSYTLSYAKDEVFTKNVQTKENIKEDSLTLHGLKQGETYYFRITAHAGNATSKPSGVLVVSLID